MLRPFLDRLYLGAGVAAAGFTILILLIIVGQVGSRWLGFPFPGSHDYAGYCMAAASFLALAHALNRGAHIRVGLMLNALGHHRRWGEIWCFGIGSVLAVYFSWYACRAVWFSYKLGDVSQGLDETPLWIPQIGMALGSIIFAIALIDHLVALLRTGEHRIDAETVDSTVRG